MSFSLKKNLKIRILSLGLSVAIGGVLLPATTAMAAITPLPDPPPGVSSYGLEATKPKEAPTVGASISVPSKGAVYSDNDSPITISGICPTTESLLVEIYDNNVLVGSQMCDNGSFAVNVSLFVGTNDFTAIVYDDINQPGPASDVTSVTYNNAHFTAFGELVSLTSQYGRRATSVKTNLPWPLELSGGTGPYAFSINWGDGSTPELKSQALAGIVTINHVYSRAGIYQVTISATDANGVSVFLQLVAVANGQNTTTTTATTSSGSGSAEILWVPTLIAFALLLPTYWIGRRSELWTLNRKVMKQKENAVEHASSLAKNSAKSP